MGDSHRRLIDYIPGFLMGLTFPLVGALTYTAATKQNLSFSSIADMHINSPFIWLIDLAPFIFAVIVERATTQSRRFQLLENKLNQHLKEQWFSDEEQSSFFQALITNSPFAIVQLDTDHRIISLNPAFEYLFGYHSPEIIGQHLDELLTSNSYYEEATQITNVVTQGKFIKQESKRKKKDGSLIDVEIIGIPVFMGGENIGALGIYNDISAQKQTERELLLSEERFKSLFYDSPISLWEEDFSAVKKHLDALVENADVVELLKTDQTLTKECIKLVKILDVNQATLDLYHVKSKQNLLEGLSKILTEDSIAPFQKELIALVNGEKNFGCEIEQKKMDGEVLQGLLRLSLAPGAEETWDKVFISIMDITERKQAEEDLRYVSFHDALTGVYNRAYFEEEMSRLEQSRQFPVTIISCDLDNLKEINDKLGHDQGDQAIRGAAKVLTNVFRTEDVIARIGGDEFAVILPYVSNVIEKSIFKRLSEEIKRYNQGNEDDGLYRPISISYGAVSVAMGESLYEGYKQADAQMYSHKQAKKKGQNNTDRE